jgi:hypothetical protein
MNPVKKSGFIVCPSLQDWRKNVASLGHENSRLIVALCLSFVGWTSRSPPSGHKAILQGGSLFRGQTTRVRFKRSMTAGAFALCSLIAVFFVKEHVNAAFPHCAFGRHVYASGNAISHVSPWPRQSNRTLPAS